MKRTEDDGHSPFIVSRSVDIAAIAPMVTTVSDLYRDHAEFVWASLHRLGVRRADLPDMTQEVFLVAHRKLDRWDRQCRATTWLFGICLKVASGYRRRAWFRREQPSLGAEASATGTPEEDMMAADARRRLSLVLDCLPPDRRAIFVMFELEERSCAEISDLFGLPIGTVHSRLHTARKEFRRGLDKLKARSRTRLP